MKHSQEQMQVAIVEWQNSGLSKKAFCRDRKITYQTFHYWCKRLSPPSSSGFSEVEVSGVHQVNVFEISFPSGARMTFQGTPSTTWLRELLK
jgi:hypothetical protein